jgi:hypothetical protein
LKIQQVLNVFIGILLAMILKYDEKKDPALHFCQQISKLSFLKAYNSNKKRKLNGSYFFLGGGRGRGGGVDHT